MSHSFALKLSFSFLMVLKTSIRQIPFQDTPPPEKPSIPHTPPGKNYGFVHDEVNYLALNFFLCSISGDLRPSCTFEEKNINIS